METQTVEAVREKIDKEQSGIIRAGEGFVCKGAPDVTEAEHRIGIIRDLKKEVDDSLGKLKAAAHASWKATCDEYNKYMKPLEAAERGYRKAIGAYAAEVERKRQAEIERAAERERKKAEAARKRAAEKIEKLLEGAADAEEELRRIEGEIANFIDEDLPSDATLDALYEKAEILRRTIDRKRAAAEATREAEKVKETLKPLPTAKTAPVTLDKGSVGFTKKAEVYDKGALIRAVADKSTPFPADLLDVNMKRLNNLVKAGLDVPGVRVISVPTVRVRKTR